MKERINLDQYKPQPHPYRAIFRRNNVSNATVANYCGAHSSYIAGILGGSLPMTQAVAAKLDPLVQQLLEEEGARA